MYGCSSWTLNKNMEATLRRAQRRMMRLIINTPRRRPQPPQSAQHDDDSETTNDDATPTNLENAITLSDDEMLEPWPEFIQRATRAVEAQLAKLKIDEWTTYYLRRKWLWARRIAQQNNNRWSKIVTQWNPQSTNHQQARRAQSRPCKRWDDDINAFLRHHNNSEHHHDKHLHNSTNNQCMNSHTNAIAHDWTIAATNTTLWQSLLNNFMKYMQQPPKRSTDHPPPACEMSI